MRVEVENVSFTYMKDTPFETTALRNVSLTLEAGVYHAIVGHTGSGKSTLMQLFNGLEKPTSGKVSVGEWEITPETKQRDLHELRRHAGVVFQFPESQLFEETILKDVMFGPLNHGKTKAEAETVAREALLRTGMPAELHDRSPFELSGGQMRRTAIAGVLAMEPQLLLLDEPTAGLDPEGQQEIMQLFYDWYREKEARTIVLISHDMNQVARFAENVVIMEQGEKQLAEKASALFTDESLLKKYQLAMPEHARLLKRLEDASGKPLDLNAFSDEAALERLLRFLREGDADA
ncbi:energy-coupling factor transporter ATPase [Alkalicoccus daliensis]|uniref:Energy-coupling factor transporter ATP-binding protein EcfA2 n=1 Tax=Alkalicoccus daliensis TaxID=745820 RepID=A0A1H0F8Q9_9BACI|nr:energy-coupling factor transporter ATPase [Alkalicoccus daliensis]SDN91048.1 energy-coupling factor transport system ATP-binding protein [Alkalicoccus daliensis]